MAHKRADFEPLHHRWIESDRCHRDIMIARRRLPGELAVRRGPRLGGLTADALTSQLFYA